MQRAAFDTKKNISGFDPNTENIVNIRASMMARGRGGLRPPHGVLTAMPPEGKCLDVTVLNKMCESCQMWKGKFI